MAAFRGMELDYDQFYPTLPPGDAHQLAKQLLVTRTATAASPAPDDLARLTQGAPVEKRWNVITICMESMSGSFTGHLGNAQKLTTCLDQLAGEGVYFQNLYATGTRTVRGMEALTLSLPPAPGQSILYRPDGVNLRTSFSEFTERSYDCAFIYGGHGQFDYMNRYFASAGCRTVDLGAWQKSDVTCATAWGACDGDLFRKTIAEADADHCASSAGKAELDVTKYHIPGILYNPALVPPTEVAAQCSQIDLMPTVFGLMGWRHHTLGFGHDLLADPANPPPHLRLSSFRGLFSDPAPPRRVLRAAAFRFIRFPLAPSRGGGANYL
jgi:phosphoglycerol transferase MdoB-like AlkP superfamily enzyme